MAPAQNHKGSQQAMDETHSLINISPQVGKGFNRDYWSRFEAFVKRLASGKGHEVFVVTGPLYLPHRAPDGKGWVMEHPMLGEPPSMVSVPTHFYKVVLVEQKGSEAGRPARLSCGAFVMPNAPIDPAMPLEAFAVPLTQLESVSGLTFFPGLINEERRLQLDGSSVRCRQAALASLSSTSTVPLLEGSSSAAAPANKSPSPGAKQPAHLCEAFACKLPAQEFWLSSKQSPEDVEVEE
uniref:Endonuclease n=1 Tax=Tetraselmis sp. GSL018 TaxID=582737 RepID=A0A061RVV9_9CHLO